MQGKTINGFELKRLLGMGGMAEVWYAENEIGLKAAVKILSEELSHNAQMQERFLNEAKVMVKLDHPNIRKVHGYGSIDGRPAIIMEYLDGSDLKKRMKDGQRFTGEEMKRWWNQMVDALSYTHAQGIVHRDIKPSNIFIDQKGNAKLLDFGIAKVADTTTGTLTGSTLGTRIYMSPEQVKDPKRVGTASDVYSLAVSFVHLLTGKAPYDSTTSSDYDIQVSIVTKPVDVSKVPVEWRGFLVPYLAKEPTDRPALRTFVATTSVPTNEDDETISNEILVSPLLQLNDKPKSRKALWIIIGVVVALALMLIFLWKMKEVPALAKQQQTQQQTFTSTQESSQTNMDSILTNTTNSSLAITVNDVSFVMKFVEGGTFWMGSNDSDAYDDEKPVHSVTVSSFYIGETEVTQALWKSVIGSNPSEWKGDSLPVERVSWNDCQEFIRKLNGLTGRNFRLPTEAEWEFASRGGNRNNGMKYAGGSSIESVAWYAGNSGSRTHAVRGKLSNELGLYDMSGNVWEWCNDWYGNYSSGLENNPEGPPSGIYRVLRGGSWINIAERCRVSYRDNRNPNNRGNYSHYGFRLCLPQ